MGRLGRFLRVPVAWRRLGIGCVGFVKKRREKLMERLGIVTACCLLTVIAVGCGEDICVSLEKDLIVLTDRLNQHAERVENKVAVQEYTFDRWAAFVPAPPAEDGEITIPEPRGSYVLPDDAKIVHWQDKFTLLQSLSVRYTLVELKVSVPSPRLYHTKRAQPAGGTDLGQLRPVPAKYTATATFKVDIFRRSKVIGTAERLPEIPANMRRYKKPKPRGAFFGIWSNPLSKSDPHGPIDVEEISQRMLAYTTAGDLPNEKLSTDIRNEIQALLKCTPRRQGATVTVTLEYDGETKQWLWAGSPGLLTESQTPRGLSCLSTLPSEEKDYVFYSDPRPKDKR
jgi:hypothetical protein